MTSNPIITKDYLRKIHLYCYEDVQDFLYVHHTLEAEMQKPIEKMDSELINECLGYIEAVMGEDTTIDEKTLDAKYQEVLARTEKQQTAQPAKVIKSKKRAVRKFFFILAATITVLFTTLTIAAKICGYDNAWEFVYQKAIEIMELDDGDCIADEGITLVKDENMERFSSFEEFLEKESLDIIYPHSLPEGLKITTVRKYSAADGKSSYTIEFKGEKAYIVFSNYSSIDLECAVDMEIYLCNNIKFYIKEHQDGSYQALYVDDIYQYAINAPDYDTLMLLLQNTKGS